MAKDTDLLKFLKSKKASKDFTKAISNNFIELIREDMDSTMKNFYGQSMSIRDWDLEDNGWIGIVVASAIEAPKAIGEIPEIISRIIKTSSEFADDNFRTSTMVSISENKSPTDVYSSNDIHTTITFTPGGGVNAEKIYDALKKTFLGGEIDIDGEIMMLNPTPGVRENILQKGADAIRDYYINEKGAEVMSRLSEDLRKELKK